MNYWDLNFVSGVWNLCWSQKMSLRLLSYSLFGSSSFNCMLAIAKREHSKVESQTRVETRFKKNFECNPSTRCTKQNTKIKEEVGLLR